MIRRVRRLRRELRLLAQLRFLPARVAIFQWRAWRLAVRLSDDFALVSATRPRNLAVLLRAAHGRRRVVELGTASAWTAISLALADRERTVLSYDPFDRPGPELYLQLVGQATRNRVTLVNVRGDDGPRDGGAIDLLYIDSSHDRDETVRELEAWRPALAAGSLVIFDDYAHPDYPGVGEAVRGLGLDGERRADLFVHRVSADPVP